jgi:hypothetical protein
MKCRYFIVLLMLTWLPGCASTPPKPAMAPLGVNGPFGYSDQPIVQDRSSISYTGPFVAVSANNPRDDGQLRAELAKTYDLALWRAAQLGQEQGYAGLKVDREQRDSDVEISDQTVIQPYPNYAYGPCRGRCYGQPFGSPWWFNDGYYDTQRRAKARAIIHLSVIYQHQFDPAEAGTSSIPALLSQMQVKWATATY